MLSDRRGESVATEFFMRAVGHNSFPNRVVIDEIGANLVGLHNMNYLLILNGWYTLIEVLQVKYLKNIIEQGHRFIKRLIRKWWDLAFSSAAVILEGIGVAHMIRKQQFDNNSGQSAFQKFAALAG